MILGAAVLYKKIRSPYPEGFPEYFAVLVFGGLVPSMGFFPAAIADKHSVMACSDGSATATRVHNCLSFAQMQRHVRPKKRLRCRVKSD